MPSGGAVIAGGGHVERDGSAGAGGGTPSGVVGSKADKARGEEVVGLLEAGAGPMAVDAGAPHSRPGAVGQMGTAGEEGWHSTGSGGEGGVSNCQPGAPRRKGTLDGYVLGTFPIVPADPAATPGAKKRGKKVKPSKVNVEIVWGGAQNMAHLAVRLPPGGLWAGGGDEEGARGAIEALPGAAWNQTGACWWASCHYASLTRHLSPTRRSHGHLSPRPACLSSSSSPPPLAASQPACLTA